jgi:hypothetical protein
MDHEPTNPPETLKSLYRLSLYRLFLPGLRPEGLVYISAHLSVRPPISVGLYVSTYVVILRQFSFYNFSLILLGRLKSLVLYYVA